MQVSVVICSFNGSDRIPITLRHLAHQRTGSTPDFEVIVVDNASTDDTADSALRSWPVDSNIPMRVVQEPKPGLQYARLAGIRAARNEIISFVDDDNWVADDWIERVSAIMSSRPEVAACGGRSIAEFETPPPAWFDKLQTNFAVGAQGDLTGDVTESRGHLWGAGLSVRKAAMEGLLSAGYSPLLSGRKGRVLVSGEDHEICYALILSGWRLWYEPALVLTHYMPAKRITWSYLRRLYFGHGVTSLGLDPYKAAMSSDPKKLSWTQEIFRSGYRFATRHGLPWIKDTLTKRPGDRKALYGAYDLGRIVGLLTLRNRYDTSFANVANFFECAVP